MAFMVMVLSELMTGRHYTNKETILDVKSMFDLTIANVIIK